VVLAERYPQWDMEKMHSSMRRRGAEYGLEFGDYRVMSNTHEALAAAEYARDRGRFPEVHEALFQAYFGQGRDIGDRNVLADVVASCGLDPADAQAALDAGVYQARLSDVRKEAALWLLQGIPLFIVNGTRTIVGAQPVATFRELLAQVR
jgi:predicted DsbA family dithiol-disulfide isomerase